MPKKYLKVAVFGSKCYNSGGIGSFTYAAYVYHYKGDWFSMTVVRLLK